MATAAQQITSETNNFDIFTYGRTVRSIKNKILSSTKKIILLTLSDHYGRNGKIYPSNKAISEETGLDMRTVRNKLSELKKDGYINYKIQRNKNRRYIQLFDPETKILLSPQLYLIDDSTVPVQVHSINKNKTIEQTNNKAEQVPKSPPEPIPKKPFVVADFKKLLRPEISCQFNLKTYHTLKKLKLTNGQIKSLINDVNNNTAIESLGWLINKAKNAARSSIPDLDRIEKDRQQEALNNKLKAISEIEKYKQWESKAITHDQAVELNLKRKGLWKLHQQAEAEQIERQKKTIDKPFAEIKPMFLEYAGELANRYTSMNDNDLMNDQAFKGFCYKEFFKCMS